MFDERSVSSGVVFLDIDGVLQPGSSQERFNTDMAGLREKLAIEVDEHYRNMSMYDIAAVRHDWSPVAVANLKTLCEKCDARIVISSNWREGRTFKELLLLFRIHKLDHLVVDTIPDLGPRDLEIQEFLNEHSEVEQFVILDDAHEHGFNTRFPQHFVHIWPKLSDEFLEKALAILQRKPKKRAELLALFDAFVGGKSSVTRIDLDIEQIGFLRRARKLSRHDFLERLCKAILDSPKLESIKIRDIDHDFTYDENKSLKPVEKIEAVAKKNPSVEHLTIEETPHGGLWGSNELTKTVISW